MSNTPYQVPGEMREFAEKSVDQARKAFEGFMGAAQKAAGQAEGTTSSLQANAKTVTEKAMAYAQDNVSAAFDLAQKLVKAKDFSEVLALQSEFAKNQMAAIQTQAKELGEAVQKSMKAK